MWREVFQLKTALDASEQANVPVSLEREISLEFLLEKCPRPRIAVHFASFLPYHIARLASLHQLVKPHGGTVIGIETCDRELKYPWRQRSGDESFKWVTLAEQETLEQLDSRRLRRTTLRMLSEIRPTAVVVAGYSRPEMRAALRWANHNATPCILMAESKMDDRRSRWWKELAKRALMPRFGAALVSGGSAVENLVRMGFPRELVFTGYDVVDNGFFASVARELRASRRSAPYQFLACCRLVEHRKNILTLLAAYKAYRERAEGDPWELVICGDGPSRSAYDSTIRQSRIRGVAFKGQKTGKELAAAYAEANCFIHPAVKEAWGLVVNEAMAAGLPVLVSRRAGCARDLVREDMNGWTFNPYDVHELTQLMLHVSGLDAAECERLGQESQRLVQPWSPETFAAQALRAIRAAMTSVPRTSQQGA